MARVRRALTARYGTYGLERLMGPRSPEERAAAGNPLSVDRMIDELGREIETELRSDDAS